MMGEEVMDEIDCGSFFDHIDDLLNFPPDETATADDDDDGGLSPNDSDSSPTDLSTQHEAVNGGGGDSFFSGNSGSSSDCSPQLSVPYEDIVQLEWLSNFVEDSFSECGMLITDKENLPLKNNTCTTILQGCGPVSSRNKYVVVGGGLPMREGEGFVGNGKGRARSKRARPATFSRRPISNLMPITSSECSAESLPQLEEREMKRKKVRGEREVREEEEEERKRKKVRGGEREVKEEAREVVVVVGGMRKCTHCEITKTPQWRAGPKGPKTLCNACGVRYKSGRLFPEYRPAASPTFVAAMHSNSHKKVLEMRVKGGVLVQVVDSVNVVVKEEEEDGVFLPC